MFFIELLNLNDNKIKVIYQNLTKLSQIDLIYRYFKEAV